MGLKRNTNLPVEGIPATSLLPGQVGRIVSWDEEPFRVGVYMMGGYEGCYTLDDGFCWYGTAKQLADCRVMVLADGELLEVVDNQGQGVPKK